MTSTAVDASGNTATCAFSVSLNAGAITGGVWDDRNRNGIEEPGEPGLSGVPFFLDAGANGTFDALTFSDVTGRYGFYGLAAGTYRVRQSVQPGTIQTTVQPADVTLTAGQQAVVPDVGNFQFTPTADFDGDRKTDLVVYRPSSGTWFWLRSNTDFVTPVGMQWGNQGLGDVPMGGDIDGDRIADLIVWRASTGTWFWLLSSTGYTVQGQKQWGNQALGDVPLLADMDGDRKADLIVWRASSGTFFWLTSSSDYAYAQAFNVQWGNQSLGDTPLLGDFDGDLKGDVAVWRGSTGTFFWLTSTSGYNPAAAGMKQWGNQSLGDTPLLGDLDGDGRSDLAVWRPGSPGSWFWLTSTTSYNTASARSRSAGVTGDIPILGDFDSDGIADITIWHPSTGVWIWVTSSSNFVTSNSKQWGAPTDIPMVK